MTQSPFPYDDLTRVLIDGLADFLVEKDAHASFNNLAGVNDPKSTWMDRIVPFQDEGSVQPPSGSRDAHPKILYSFTTLFAPSDVGWPKPMRNNDREVPRATEVMTGTTTRARDHGTLLVSDTSFSANDALPWDLVVNDDTDKSARILQFLDEHRAKLNAPILFNNGVGFTVWRSDYYFQRPLHGTTAMQWSGLARRERQSNLLGNLLLEYFNEVADEDLLVGCLWGNEGQPHPQNLHELRVEESGSLTPAQQVSDRQEIFHRADLDVTFQAVATIERKRDPITSAMLQVQTFFGEQPVGTWRTASDFVGN